MLAYTTFSDIFVIPTALEVTVYLLGLMLLIACPYLLLSLMDKFSRVKDELKEQPQGNPEI